MSITVYTVITGGKDALIDQQEKGSARFVAFLEHPAATKTWEVVPSYKRFKDDRRNSRAQKILPHLFLDTEYSIYIDGNMQLTMSPDEIVAKYLKNHDLALFKHQSRTCVYDELEVIKRMNFDLADDCNEQAQFYKKDGYAENKGLCECGFIVRRHTPKVRAFNNEWWAQYTRFAKRDQPSFMYAVNEFGLRINVIDDGWEIRPNGAYRAGVYRIVNHLTPRT